MFGPIFWKMEHGDPLILFHFLTACAINNRFWQKKWHILFDPKLSRAILILRVFLNRKNSQNIVPANNSNNKVGYIHTEPPGFRNLKFHASTQLSDDQWKTDKVMLTKNTVDARELPCKWCKLKACCYIKRNTFVHFTEVLISR